MFLAGSMVTSFAGQIDLFLSAVIEDLSCTQSGVYLIYFWIVLVSSYARAFIVKALLLIN